jgi:hypothetical protein
MRDLRRVEKDAVLLKNVETTFFPIFKQTITFAQQWQAPLITTQRLKGRIVCRIERKVKYMKKGGED